MEAGFCRETPTLCDIVCKLGLSCSNWGISSLILGKQLGITCPRGKERMLSTDGLWRQCQDWGPFKPCFFCFLLKCLVFSSLGNRLWGLLKSTALFYYHPPPHHSCSKTVLIYIGIES